LCILKPIARTVSLAPNLTEIVFALGAGKRLVGRTTRCDYPPEASKVPAIGEYLKPDPERLISLNPDLVLTTKTGTRKEMVSRLEDLGLKVFVADSRNVNDVFSLIRRVGILLGTPDKARALVSELEQRRKALRQKLAKVKKPSVLFLVGTRPLVVAGGKSPIGAMIREVQGVNIAEDALIPHPRYSGEEVIRKDPDLIIMLGKEHMDRDASLADLKRLGELSALRKGRVYQVDGNVVARPSPRVIEGMERLATILHPELFQADSVGPKTSEPKP
jgi:iron complex transport system substrate-binding protein